MARAAITFVRLDRHVFTPNPVATTLDSVNGNFALNDGASFLELNNTALVSRTISVEVPEQVDQNLPVTSRTYTLNAGQVGKTGIYPREVYGSQLLVDVSGAGVQCVVYSVR